MALIASRNFETMYKNATDSTTRLNSGVTIAMNQLANGSTETINTMKGQITTDWFNMHKQVYSETQVMSSDAVAAMTRLNGDMTDQAASMDANVIGYWHDAAAYIARPPINGHIPYTPQLIPCAA